MLIGCSQASASVGLCRFASGDDTDSCRCRPGVALIHCRRCRPYVAVRDCDGRQRQAASKIRAGGRLPPQQTSNHLQRQRHTPFSVAPSTRRQAALSFHWRHEVTSMERHASAARLTDAGLSRHLKPRSLHGDRRAANGHVVMTCRPATSQIKMVTRK